MRLRERVGRWLWPEGVRSDEELFRLRNDISDLWWWGVSDEIALAAAWLRNRSRWRRMSVLEMQAETDARMWPQHPLRAEIGAFRRWVHEMTPEQAATYVRTEQQRLGGKSPHLPSENSAADGALAPHALGTGGQP